jgi:hypothetical protein|tara:strand:+ start:537 stop:821 length:285 start_codon:yes stop_codon:yes gene_type:complete
MQGFGSLGLDDIARLQKRGIRLNESYGASVRTNEDKPLSGVTIKQRNRNKNAGDVLNIGSGTRCKHCGMLYFCWVDTCRTCKKPVDFNLGVKQQ